MIETGTREKSARVYAEACRSIPLGVNSPVRAFPGMETTPLVVDSGYGDTILDVDGNRYIDYCQSWGALIHGHAHPAIVEAAQKRVAAGSTFGATTAIEGKIAAKVTEHVPSIEKVRFVSSGTEATMSAVRLARGFTERDLIVKFNGHYHGHADAFLVKAGSGATHLPASAGVPGACAELTLCLPFNDFEAARTLMRGYGNKIAAVILEPIAANMGVVLPKPGFLELLREECDRAGALLIFDEVITGFRVALGGAQEFFEISADLTCLGKIVGGGFPAAAFGGREEIMECLAPQGPVYQAGTLSGNPVAMEAGLETLRLLERPGFYEELADKTLFVTEPIQELIDAEQLDLTMAQAPGLFTLFFGKGALDPKRFATYFTALFERGIYVPPSQYEAHFISAAHTYEHLAYTRETILECLSQVLC